MIRKVAVIAFSALALIAAGLHEHTLAIILAVIAVAMGVM